MHDWALNRTLPRPQDDEGDQCAHDNVNLDDDEDDGEDMMLNLTLERPEDDTDDDVLMTTTAKHDEMLNPPMC
jgi:hypothetical protein